MPKDSGFNLHAKIEHDLYSKIQVIGQMYIPKHRFIIYFLLFFKQKSQKMALKILICGFLESISFK